MFEMALNSFVISEISFVISEINLYQLFEGIHLKININLGEIFVVQSKSRLEIKEFPVDMPFPGEGVWLVNWLGNWILEGGIGGYTPFYIQKHAVQTR